MKFYDGMPWRERFLHDIDRGLEGPMTRQAVADDTVGGYRIPAKALSRRPDGYRGGRGDFLWGVALPALAATAVAGGDGRLGGVLDADRIVFWILPGENFLPYAREHGSVKNARNPFTAASPRDCCGLADTAAWQILRKIQVANACHFWRGVGGDSRGCNRVLTGGRMNARTHAFMCPYVRSCL